MREKLHAVLVVIAILISVVVGLIIAKSIDDISNQDKIPTFVTPSETKARR